MNPSLKQVLLICVCLLALTGQVIADSLSDAKRAYDAKDFTKAAKLYMPLAQQGDAFVQYKLGVMYSMGRGVPQDYEETAG